MRDDVGRPSGSGRWLYRLGRCYHWFRAFVGGYFWLPCPICRRNFGGHELKGDWLMRSWGEGEGVCPDCGPEAQRRNEAWMKAHPHPPIIIQEPKTAYRLYNWQ